MVEPQDAQILKLRITYGAWKNIDLLLLVWSTISVAALVIQMQGPYGPILWNIGVPWGVS